mgnify:CR=1 FL=1|tara:strand:+ start:153 stop:332 length:180 start_codon:yes stop_codon:yes gene_type:complete
METPLTGIILGPLTPIEVLREVELGEKLPRILAIFILVSAECLAADWSSQLFGAVIGHK